MALPLAAIAGIVGRYALGALGSAAAGYAVNKGFQGYERRYYRRNRRYPNSAGYNAIKYGTMTAASAAGYAAGRYGYRRYEDWRMSRLPAWRRPGYYQEDRRAWRNYY